MKGKKKKLVEGFSKVIRPGDKKQKEEDKRDQSQSAEKERGVVERQDKEGKRGSIGEKLGEKVKEVLTLSEGKREGG